MARSAKVPLLVIACALPCALALAWVWERGWLQARVKHWLQHRVIDAYVARIEKDLPFKISELEFEAGWDDFKQGRLKSLSVTLTRDGWVARLEGPFHLMPKDAFEYFEFDYAPHARISYRGKPVAELELRLGAETHSALKSWRRLEFTARAARLQWADWTLDRPVVEGRWPDAGGQAMLTLDASSLSRGDSLNVSRPRLQARAELNLDPFALGQQAVIDLRPDGVEAVLGENYLDLPLSKLPARVTLSREHALLELGGFRASLTPVPAWDTARSAQLTWKGSRLPFSRLWKLAGGVSALKPFAQVRTRGGELETDGSVRLPWPWNGDPGELRGEAHARLSRLALQSATREWTLNDFEADLPWSSGRGVPGASLSIGRLQFQAFRGSLSRMRLSWRPDGRLEMPDGIPLKLAGVPITVGALTGTLAGERTELETRASIGPVQLETIARGLCTEGRILPGELRVEFPRIDIGTDYVEPTGAAKLSLFGGELKVDELAAYDLLSGAPELQFNLDWGGIRLDQLGDWLGFGEMDGYLVGYAHDVVLQSWLPTQFDLRAEVKPRSHSDVVFSPMAMKNTLHLIMGQEAVDQLFRGSIGPLYPFFFGWIARLFGGYDIDYAGITLFSSNGTILLDTLDPRPKNVDEAFAKAEQNHFILKGTRFKIPLKSSRYPVVVDAPRIAQYFRDMLNYFRGLAQSKENKSEKPILPCLAPELAGD